MKYLPKYDRLTILKFKFDQRVVASDVTFFATPFLLFLQNIALERRLDFPAWWTTRKVYRLRFDPDDVANVEKKKSNWKLQKGRRRRQSRL